MDIEGVSSQEGAELLLQLAMISEGHEKEKVELRQKRNKKGKTTFW